MSETRHITEQEARDVLVQVITEFPDRRTEGCTYRRDATEVGDGTWTDLGPDCVVGVALDRLGLKLDLEEGINDSAFYMVADHWFEGDDEIAWDHDARELYERAQAIQDASGNYEDLRDADGRPPWSKIKEILDL